MSRRVLIVTPHFPPLNAPDHQRVRMSLPYYEDYGWTPTVLAGDPDGAGGLIDPLLSRTIPSTIDVHRVIAWNEQKCRRLGFGHFGLRCLLPLYRKGNDLLAGRRFDLIFFSTTLFNILPVGLPWKSRFKIPYVVDLQDPWYVGPKVPYTDDNAPGGAFKYKTSQRAAKYLERLTLTNAAGIISVSQRYIDDLTDRYGNSIPAKSTVIPFGAPQLDFELLPSFNLRQSIFDPADGFIHWVSVGRAGGPGLDEVLSCLFSAILELKSAQPTKWSRLKLHFVGTSYAEKQKRVEELAVAAGLRGTVLEHPIRIPYFEALKTLTDADGVLLLGNIRSDYTASRLFPCLLAKRPFAAVFHEDSLVNCILRELSPESLISFRCLTSCHRALKEGLDRLYARSLNRRPIHIDLTQYSAEKLTAVQCKMFEQALLYHAST